jgi:hypothetical protein
LCLQFLTLLFNDCVRSASSAPNASPLYCRRAASRRQNSQVPCVFTCLALLALHTNTCGKQKCERGWSSSLVWYVNEANLCCVCGGGINACKTISLIQKRVQFKPRVSTLPFCEKITVLLMKRSILFLT